MSNQIIRNWCPECGKEMYLREHLNKYNPSFKPYWYCSDYPECLGTRDILLDGRPDFSDDYLD
jgi:ssDNA-binding Zn-finger/Zn-ribbon topoisomerase 1